MKSISGKNLCKMLEKKGWELKTIRGVEVTMCI